MAIYKIFPEKSATLYSYYPTKNTGRDEIIEVSIYSNVLEARGDVARGLIKFTSTEINDVIQNKVAGSTYSASLKLYLADASNMPLDYSLLCNPIYGSWDRGTGRAANLPITTNGAGWAYRLNSSTQASWLTSGFVSGVTASYDTEAGGGNWYTGSYEVSQSFTYNDSKDISFDVTNIVDAFYSSSISNEGFIIRHSGSLEFTSGSSIELKYFSGNTHTIYPPCLEIKWNDFSYSTGSLSEISSDNIVLSFGNNVGEYQQNSVQSFRLNVRDKYPARTFQTSSAYLNNKLLPTASCWSIMDADTNEIVVDFDDTFTKISADSNGNYFKVYMDGLEAERYFKLLVKTTIDGSTLVIDNNNIFKVIQ